MPKKYTWGPHLHSPFESFWSMIQKFTYLNLLGYQDLKSILVGDKQTNLDVDSLTSHIYNLDTVKMLLGLTDQHILRMYGKGYMVNIHKFYRHFPRDIIRPNPRLRFCHDCMKVGFHSAFYQMSHTKRCLLHDQAIQSHCPQCGDTISTIFTRNQFNNIYGCSCGYKLSNLDDAGSPGAVLERRYISEAIERYSKYVHGVNRLHTRYSKNKNAGITFLSPKMDYYPDKVDLAINHDECHRYALVSLDLDGYKKTNIVKQTKKNKCSHEYIVESYSKIIRSIGRHIHKCGRSGLIEKRPKLFGTRRHKLVGDQAIRYEYDLLKSIDLKIFDQYWRRYWFKPNRKLGIGQPYIDHLSHELLRKRNTIKKVLLLNINCNQIDLDSLLDRVIFFWFLELVVKPAKKLAVLVEMQEDLEVSSYKPSKIVKIFKHLDCPVPESLFILFNRQENKIHVFSINRVIESLCVFP